LSAFLDHYGANANKILMRRISENRPALHVETEQLYERTFTPEELSARRKFYSTRIGKSIAFKQSTILGGLAGVGRPYAARVYAIDSTTPPSQAGQ
jgi:hypothetical protein